MNKVKELQISAGSVIGGREENQDNLLIDMIGKPRTEANHHFAGNVQLDGRKFFIVCDGMGGEANGAVASKLAVEYFEKYMSYLKGDITPVDVMKCMLEINEQITAFYSFRRECGGTTISLVQINEDSTMEVYNMGDSPVFLYRDETLELISEEQSLAGMKLKHNMIDEEQYETSRERSVLLGYLGDQSSKSLLHLYYRKMPVKSGDKIIIASDGLTGGLPKSGLEEMLKSEAKAEELIAEAAKKEESDNVTAILITIV